MSLRRFLKLSGRLWLQGIKRKGSALSTVRYLGLIISEGTRAIGPERIKLILNHLLPMTLRQLRRFLEITGYCHIWIPLNRELAWPLYKLIAETQQAQTNWFGLQKLKRLLRFFRLLSCKLQL